MVKWVRGGVGWCGSKFEGAEPEERGVVVGLDTGEDGVKALIFA